MEMEGKKTKKTTYDNVFFSLRVKLYDNDLKSIEQVAMVAFSSDGKEIEHIVETLPKQSSDSKTKIIEKMDKLCEWVLNFEKLTSGRIVPIGFLRDTDDHFHWRKYCFDFREKTPYDYRDPFWFDMLDIPSFAMPFKKGYLTRDQLRTVFGNTLEEKKCKNILEDAREQKDLFCQIYNTPLEDDDIRVDELFGENGIILSADMEGNGTNIAQYAFTAANSSKEELGSIKINFEDREGHIPVAEKIEWLSSQVITLKDGTKTTVLDNCKKDAIDPRDAMKQLSEWISNLKGDNEVYLVCYPAAFDYYFWKMYCQEFGINIKLNVIDGSSFSWKRLGLNERPSLKKLSGEYYSSEELIEFKKNAHDAKADSEFQLVLFFRTIEKTKNLNLKK